MILPDACVVAIANVGDDFADLMQPNEDTPVLLLLGGEGGVSGLMRGVHPK